MSDDDSSSGIIGSLISLVLLIVLWPYILAAIGIFIAYLLLVEMLSWVGAHLLLTISVMGLTLAIYLVFKCNLIGRVVSYLSREIRLHKERKGWTPVQELILQADPEILDRPFVPSTNLYCYWCTKKLGAQSWEKGGKYYCHHCYEKLLGLVNQD